VSPKLQISFLSAVAILFMSVGVPFGDTEADTRRSGI
jgi:hypothetical protein